MKSFCVNHPGDNIPRISVHDEILFSPQIISDIDLGSDRQCRRTCPPGLYYRVTLTSTRFDRIRDVEDGVAPSWY